MHCSCLAAGAAGGWQWGAAKAPHARASAQFGPAGETASPSELDGNCTQVFLNFNDYTSCWSNWLANWQYYTAFLNDTGVWVSGTGTWGPGACAGFCASPMATACSRPVVCKLSGAALRRPA